jgi:hypothetical protein
MGCKLGDKLIKTGMRVLCSKTKLALAQGAGHKLDHLHCKQDMLCSS